MLAYASILTLAMVAACVFVPVFVIALIVLKQLSRAFVIAVVFAGGATAGFLLAGMGGHWAVGRAVASEMREALLVAFATAGAVAGGVLAVWALEKNNKEAPWRR
ncbi:MAG TPA: hypothetical protein VGQ27_00560 [Steroidobacteraceae bacterium]|jgi:hypothetical protein|nr:hypothetical protein [Steroidobacteraceae bacterium]